MKWEYKELSVGIIKSSTDSFNKLGLEGWELVSVDNGMAYFKRELKPKSEAEILKYFDETRSSMV